MGQTDTCPRILECCHDIDASVSAAALRCACDLAKAEVLKETNYEDEFPEDELPPEDDSEDEFEDEFPEDELPPKTNPPPKTNCEDEFPEDELPPEDEFPPEDELRRRIPRRRIPEDEFPPKTNCEDEFPKTNNQREEFPPRKDELRKTNSEDEFPEDELPPEDEFPPEDELRRRIPRRRIAPEDEFPEDELPPEDEFPPEDELPPKTNSPKTNCPPKTNSPPEDELRRRIPRRRIAPRRRIPPRRRIAKTNSPKTNPRRRIRPRRRIAKTNSPKTNSPKTNPPRRRIPKTNSPKTNCPPETNCEDEFLEDELPPEDESPPKTNSEDEFPEDELPPKTNFPPKTNSPKTKCAPKANSPRKKRTDPHLRGTHARPMPDTLLATSQRLRILAKAYDVSLCDVEGFVSTALSVVDECVQTGTVEPELTVTLLELLALISVRHAGQLMQPLPAVAADVRDERQLQQLGAGEHSSRRSIGTCHLAGQLNLELDLVVDLLHFLHFLQGKVFKIQLLATRFICWMSLHKLIILQFSKTDMLCICGVVETFSFLWGCHECGLRRLKSAAFGVALCTLSAWWNAAHFGKTEEVKPWFCQLPDALQDALANHLGKLLEEDLMYLSSAEGFFTTLLAAVKFLHKDSDMNVRLLRLTPPLQKALLNTLRRGVVNAAAGSAAGFLEALTPWITKHVVEDVLIDNLASWAKEQSNQALQEAGLEKLLEACKNTVKKLDPESPEKPSNWKQLWALGILWRTSRLRNLFVLCIKLIASSSILGT
ncbi:unnamed protein product [Cladocopium goreaui]|uniref:Uncharacterized protein n=1 Tax=Cladocopium goreaui TaxID=2562237 RepID=A0A9P1BH89_9DINO|nr:unnamed protein product [Cladocopium goreaui]